MRLVAAFATAPSRCILTPDGRTGAPMSAATPLWLGYLGRGYQEGPTREVRWCLRAKEG
jgi:hypothetical protein